MQNVLLVEDEAVIGRSLKQYLSKYFYQVRHVDCYEKGMEEASTLMPDILCVDINLGGEKSGLDLCREIRKMRPDLPMLIVTAGDVSIYLEETFHIGLTDYISKPYHPEEVRIRMMHLLELRKNFAPAVNRNVVEYVTEDFSLLHSHSKVCIQGEEKHLPKTLRHLLELFLQNKNKILSHQFLQEKIWGDYFSLEKKREIRAHTKRLRHILGPKYGPLLLNIKAQGYIFKVP